MAHFFRGIQAPQEKGATMKNRTRLMKWRKGLLDGVLIVSWIVLNSAMGQAQKKIRKQQTHGNVAIQGIQSSQNLMQCKAYYNKLGLKRQGLKNCTETYQRVSYGSPNFKACFEIYGKGRHAHEAPTTCAILTKKFQFEKNQPFQQCFRDQKKKLGQETAATACMNYVNNLLYLKGLSS